MDGSRFKKSSSELKCAALFGESSGSDAPGKSGGPDHTEAGDHGIAGDGPTNEGLASFSVGLIDR
jgi:hypothetical protein